MSATKETFESIGPMTAPPTMATSYDIAIIGGGHNGLVAACYLARAGLSVIVLERNAELGGATRSKRLFAGIDARISVYSYLISLFPEKIVSDLGLALTLQSRKTASWTPSFTSGSPRELLLRNASPDQNREAFVELTGNESDYRGFLKLQAMQQSLADVVWPSLTTPLVSGGEMRSRLDRQELAAWRCLVEEPLGNAVERLISDDLIRGLVFTDAKIGVSTFPHDPSLLQNRSFLYHVIGRGTGEWRVPVGGMGALVDELVRVAAATGRVTFVTAANVSRLHPDKAHSSLTFERDGKTCEIDARFVLCNASSQVLGTLIGKEPEEIPATPAVEGAGFKINMVLERLPRLKSQRCQSSEAFAGTFHIDEGYEQMLTSYRESAAGKLPDKPPGEIYCHTLTDDSILSDELKRRGFHTLTLFGLDLPYRLFENDNVTVREEVVRRYLAGINQFLEEPIESCLAQSTKGTPCIEAMSAIDLENAIHLPKGNIFHGGLSWPFAETEEEIGQWGVETVHPNIFVCGSSAKRGGAVSGIPGHNAAMKVLECIRS
jgi:phytoene dehydrogenase-like protein